MQNDQFFPVSFGQQRLLFLDQLSPGTTAYNLTRAIRVTGPLNVSALIETFHRIVRRHASLRTKFLQSDEGYQIVSADAELLLPILNMSDLPSDIREQELRRLANEEMRKSFVLTAGPLFRASIIKFGDTDHVLLLVMHHIITDGWSMGILFQEIGQIYAELYCSTPATLPVLSVQYPDFARWQRATFTAEYLRSDIEYWTTKLHGHEGFLALPTNRPRPAIQSHDGAIVRFTIVESLVRSLKLLADATDTTLFMILFSTFVTFLWRYTDSDDIVVGTPMAARNDAQLEPLIGLFVNTLAIRTDLSGNPTFFDLLRRVRETMLEAFDHQKLPFEQLVEALQLKRSLSYSPLFQVFQNMPKQVLELPGLVSEEIDLDSGSAKFDLTIEIVEQDCRCVCSFEYSTTLFEQDAIDCLARNFVTLVSDIAEHPERPLSDLKFIDEATRTDLVFSFNSTAAAYRQDARLEQLFEEQAQRTPDQVALVDGNLRITYRELGSRADALAAYLNTLGLNQTRPIGVFLRRSVGAVVAFLAALKTNTPYVPLDVANPPYRLQAIMSHAGCQTVVTNRQLGNALPNGTKLILIDEAIPRHNRSAHRSVSRSSEDVAYIIYTSGSTGVPKGVEGTHRAAINRFEWMWRVYPFSLGERCCHKTALGFVDSLWEIFGPLLAGVPAIIIPDEPLLDPDQFVDLLAQYNVTRIVLIPSLLRTLLDIVPDLSKRLPELQLWSVSGEPLSLDLAKSFGEALPAATLVNIYGSSEVAADVTYHQIGSLQGVSSVPIGRPISNVQIFVLDRNKTVVPPLVPGEIHVGGDCLARGYWMEPDLTSQRFIKNPYCGDQSARLFVTGDLGRILTDGTIEYLGRVDRQIKLRGMRIEPGEIETCLGSHPDVLDAAVAVQGDRPERQRLLAYIVRRTDSDLPTEDLRAFLRRRVPDYMVPAEFVELDRMPMLPSGKLDRTKLEALNPFSSDRRRATVQPRTEVERKLKVIWKEVLELDEVGIDDDFFDLGGHSLGAMRVLARVRRDFHVDITIRRIFESPTIAEFALEVETQQRVGVGVEEKPIAATANTSSLLDVLRSQLNALSPGQMDAILQTIAAEKDSRARAED
jgi:amino acid adenylation domain-containing protein